MPRTPRPPAALTKAQARRLWLGAQRLDTLAPFGSGPEAMLAAVEHLGYVQIDTIHVIERCHHHILWSRIPDYRRADLHDAQSRDKTVFEYWTHALSYVPARDLRFFLPAMKRYRTIRAPWYGSVTKADLKKTVERIRDGGPLTIRDIDDDLLIEKDHPWASRKPSKRALQYLFYTGVVTISARAGMLKTYELTDRHFGWTAPPRPATERQINDYLLDRALRSQGVVSLDSVCYLDAKRKAAVREAVEARIKRRALVPVAIEDVRAEHWAEPDTLDGLKASPDDAPVHILSPFDPLIIQRKRLASLFDYEHRFEAYVPKEKRVFGYFALPVLVGDRIVAAIDCKTDRASRRLLIQQWTWIVPETAALKAAIDDALARFERFQLPPADSPEEAALALEDALF